MKRALWPALALLAGCAGAAPPRPAPCPAPASPGGIVIRYFDGVLVLPPEYVLDGTALPAQVRFQGPQGQLRLGATRAAGEFLAQAERSAAQRETICGLEVLRSPGDPPVYVLRTAQAYAIASDRDPDVVRRLLEVYCASVAGDG